jgi:hypothetical protein
LIRKRVSNKDNEHKMERIPAEDDSLVKEEGSVDPEERDECNKNDEQKMEV